jgi:hypothetical protein
MIGIHKKWFLPEIFGFRRILDVKKRGIKALESRIVKNSSN